MQNFTQSRKLDGAMASETISLTELRPRLSELVQRAHERFDRFMITRRGRVEAVLLSSEEFEGLLETLEMLSDDELVGRLAEADRELAEDRGTALEELRAELA
jgi:prevent-host-death family protein